MKIISLALALSGLLVLSSCSDSNSDSNQSAEIIPGSGSTMTENENPGSNEQSEENPNETNSPGASTETTATYRVTFNGTWSAATHPVNYPASAHFSGLVGAIHNDQVIFWEPGQIATDGIELMAETGGKSIFLEEIDSAITSGYALSAIDGPGIASSPGTASVEVTVTADFPNLTVTTMIAPSPDWFVGLHGVKLYENGEFVDALTIDAPSYDSGTDSGVGFTSGDIDTQPRDVIVRTTSDPSDTDFVNGLPIAGQFIIEKL